MFVERYFTHPVVLVELACSTPPAPRARTLHDIGLLQYGKHATWTEVMELIEARQFYNRGCTSSDLTLLASTLMTPGALLWTLDKRLSQLAGELAIAYTHDVHQEHDLRETQVGLPRPPAYMSPRIMPPSRRRAASPLWPRYNSALSQRYRRVRSNSASRVASARARSAA